MNKEIIDIIKSTKTVDELKEAATKNGYVLSDEEASAYFATFHTDGKIGDDELTNITGGYTTKGGFCYGGEAPCYLIIGATHAACELYKGDPTRSVRHCGTCENADDKIMFCTVRTLNNDPLNKYL